MKTPSVYNFIGKVFEDSIEKYLEVLWKHEGHIAMQPLNYLDFPTASVIVKEIGYKSIKSTKTTNYTTSTSETFS